MREKGQSPEVKRQSPTDLSNSHVGVWEKVLTGVLVGSTVGAGISLAVEATHGFPLVVFNASMGAALASLFAIGAIHSHNK